MVSVGLWLFSQLEARSRRLTSSHAIIGIRGFIHFDAFQADSAQIYIKGRKIGQKAQIFTEFGGDYDS